MDYGLRQSFLTMARRWTIGVDFGGTNIKVGCVANGVVVRTVVLATAAHPTPAAFLHGVEGAIERLCAGVRISRAQVGGVGVGVPGLVDGARGVIHRLVNVPGGWPKVPLRQLLEQRLRLRCAVDNDVNVVALGEWRFGAGRGTRDSVYVTLGTGVGGGLIINGALARGATGSAGEIGHTTIQLDGPRCACGGRGCLEALVGTSAIIRGATQAIRSGSRQLADAARRHEGRLSPEAVSRAASRGDRAALRIWRDVGCALGVAMANVINLLNPERIVIGGGVAKAWPWFAPHLRATIRAHAFEVPANACKVVKAALGDRAGILGAALLVWEQEQVRGAR